MWTYTRFCIVAACSRARFVVLLRLRTIRRHPSPLPHPPLSNLPVSAMNRNKCGLSFALLRSLPFLLAIPPPPLL